MVDYQKLPPEITAELRAVAQELCDVITILNVLCSVIEEQGGRTRLDIAAELERRRGRMRRESAILDMMITVLTRAPGDPVPPPPSWFKGVIEGGEGDDQDTG